MSPPDCLSRAPCLRRLWLRFDGGLSSSVEHRLNSAVTAAGRLMSEQFAQKFQQMSGLEPDYVPS